MSRKFQFKGEYVILPIIGDVVSEINFGASRHPYLIFESVHGEESQLTLWHSFTLSFDNNIAPDDEQETDFFTNSTIFNRTSDVKQMTQLLDVLGNTVVDAWAYKTGSLQISFSNKQVLHLVPSSGFEAWQFRYPWPGRIASRPIGSGASQDISLIGDTGRLI